MCLRKVIRLLKLEYKKAKALRHIVNPVAYALQQVSKEVITEFYESSLGQRTQIIQCTEIESYEVSDGGQNEAHGEAEQ